MNILHVLLVVLGHLTSGGLFDFNDFPDTSSDKRCLSSRDISVGKCILGESSDRPNLYLSYFRTVTMTPLPVVGKYYADANAVLHQALFSSRVDFAIKDIQENVPSRAFAPIFNPKDKAWVQGRATFAPFYCEFQPRALLLAHDFICHNTSLRGSDSRPVGLISLFKGKPNEEHTESSYKQRSKRSDKHAERPNRHILLRLQVILGGVVSLAGIAGFVGTKQRGDEPNRLSAYADAGFYIFLTLCGSSISISGILFPL